MNTDNFLASSLVPTDYNVLSLGAGVQSSCLALMAANGKTDQRLNAAVFADTQAEPASVYKWLDVLTEEIARSPYPFPIHRITKGSLTDASLELRERMRTTGPPWSKSLIPAFVKNPDGSKGIMGRSCTYDYKYRILLKFQRKLGKIRYGQKHVSMTAWIGISYDEMQRMKVSKKPWVQHRWPLVEMKMRRSDCLTWMKENGYPVPPRSACVYCPFHSNAEWRRLRDHEPEEFARAIDFEQKLQEVKRLTPNMKGVPFLHSSLMTLDKADISEKLNPLQQDLFQNECEGMCGV